MKVTQGPPVPPSPPPFVPIVVTLETALEACVLRCLTSDAGDARTAAKSAAMSGQSYLSLPTKFVAGEAGKVLEALRWGLKDAGYEG